MGHFRTGKIRARKGVAGFTKKWFGLALMGRKKPRSGNGRGESVEGGEGVRNTSKISGYERGGGWGWPSGSPGGQSAPDTREKMCGCRFNWWDCYKGTGLLGGGRLNSTFNKKKKKKKKKVRAKNAFVEEGERSTRNCG